MLAATNCGDHPEISVLMQVSLRFDTNLERDAIDSIASNLAPLFEPGGDVPPHRIGLYLSSADAGVATSVRFWSEARRTGLGMANPELFPWCLANAPAAALARRFGITGPNYTLLGEGDALLAVFNTASDDLLTERIDAAVVIALEMKTGRCSGLRLARAAAAAPTVQTGDLTGHSGCAPGTCPPLLSAVGRGTLETTDAAQTLSSDRSSLPAVRAGGSRSRGPGGGTPAR